VPQVLSMAEAATVLTISKRTMTSLVERGRLKTIRVGRRRVVPRAALEEFLGCSLNR
jgi:excisionase family DNA binding protein